MTISQRVQNHDFIKCYTYLYCDKDGTAYDEYNQTEYDDATGDGIETVPYAILQCDIRLHRYPTQTPNWHRYYCVVPVAAPISDDTTKLVPIQFN